MSGKQSGSCFKYFRLVIAAALLVALPFGPNVPRAAAAPMEHMGGDMHATCALLCSQLSNSAPQQPILGQDEMRAPDPTPYLLEPYYLQFRRFYAPKVLRPASMFGTHVIRPPDIVALTANYRF
jgi:hypothetical protein